MKKGGPFAPLSTLNVAESVSSTAVVGSTGHTIAAPSPRPSLRILRFWNCGRRRGCALLFLLRFLRLAIAWGDETNWFQSIYPTEVNKRPSSMRTRRSATSRMRGSWVTINTEHACSRASRLSKSTTSRPVVLSSAAVGSSANNNCGWGPGPLQSQHAVSVPQKDRGELAEVISKTDSSQPLPGRLRRAR